MNWMKIEWTYVREVYGPSVADKPKYEDREPTDTDVVGGGRLDSNKANVVNNCECARRRAHELAWEAMWREVDAFWVRSGAALVILGGATSLLFRTGLSELESAILSLGVLFMVIAWRQINLGSLAWMGSWMTHVDSMEDDVTGPLYKTVFHMDTHSTTKSIAHLSLLGVWVATVNAAVQVRQLAICWIDGVEKDCPGLVGLEGRLALIGAIWILCALLIGMFIRWNISFTKDEKKDRYLRRVAINLIVKQVEK